LIESTKYSLGEIAMNAVYVHQTVGEIVAQNPGLAGVFESMGIDYCCGGKKSLIETCREKELEPRAVLGRLRESGRRAAQTYAPSDVAGMTVTELVDHIEDTHHAYLRKELPRLGELAIKVASRHAEKDPRLYRVQQTLAGMSIELWQHMQKEEQCLFPMIRQLERGTQPSRVSCATIANPIRQMETEHDDAGAALARLRELTDGFSAPKWACNTYRALLAALAHFERDMHSHVHKENNVLFPNALRIEALQHRGSPVSGRKSAARHTCQNATKH
jgi:regulator of cell morphogenesis and NO signaling